MSYYVTYESVHGVRTKRFSSEKEVKKFSRSHEDDILEIERGKAVSKRSYRSMMNMTKRKLRDIS